MFDMTLSELVRGKPVSTMPTEVYAELIADKIAEEDEIRAECEQLRGELAEVHDQEDELRKLTEALRALVDAIDNSKVGKLCKVGALVIVEDRGALTSPQLSEALEAARKLL